MMFEERWPRFTDGQTVRGMKIFNLIDWIYTSDRMLNGGKAPEGMPVIAMPPVQRTAVWQPKQVLELWDSLMRGLPIGTLYLVAQSADIRQVVQPTTGKTIAVNRQGFDLLNHV